MNINNQSHKSCTQRGFTLIELLVVIAITGVLLPAAGVSVYQITRGSQSSNSRMAAINNVQRAGEYISQDVRQSQISLGYGASAGFPLNITWTDFGTGDLTEVTYTYSNNELTREYSVTSASGVELANSTIVVARSISEISATPINPEGQVLTVELTVTSTFTDPFTGQPTGESRTYEIRPRGLD